MEVDDVAGIGRVHHRLRDSIYPELVQADMPIFLGPGRAAPCRGRPSAARCRCSRPRRYVAVPGLMGGDARPISCGFARHPHGSPDSVFLARMWQTLI